MDIKDVENLAELARIELGEDEKKEILSDMKGILDYVNQIQEVKIPAKVGEKGRVDVESDYRPYNVWREDLPAGAGEGSFSRELIIEQFPDAQDNFLKVKKIL